MDTLRLALLTTLVFVPGAVAWPGDDTVAGKDEPQVIFKDRFESKLEKEWSWLREDSKGWRVTKEGLEIRVGPEHGTARKNILLSPARQAKGELIAEVFVDAKQTANDEHAGLQCYFDEKNWVGLIKEFHGKPCVQLTQKKDDKYSYKVNGDAGQAVWLRMVVSESKAVGYYRATEKDEWKKAAECEL